ncbi:MAG: hypothetical protein FWE23_09210 [Chitinivibrionia bacterium]|nr:hypothetical protein [Chitinivibrionia bacterium]
MNSIEMLILLAVVVFLVMGIAMYIDDKIPKLRRKEVGDLNKNDSNKT